MAAHSALSAWESFYVIVGSSAAALTGLQFVVIALVSETEMRAGTKEVAAFGTPTVVHFCAVLLTAAILSAPWSGLAGAAAGIGICGLLGTTYVVITARRAKRTTLYTPVLEDWIWHVFLPLVAYVVLIGAAATLNRFVTPALFAIGASALLLLFIGIHNAWDTVTYIALDLRQSAGTSAPPPQPTPAHDSPEQVSVP